MSLKKCLFRFPNIFRFYQNYRMCLNHEKRNNLSCSNKSQRIFKKVRKGLLQHVQGRIALFLTWLFIKVFNQHQINGCTNYKPVYFLFIIIVFRFRPVYFLFLRYSIKSVSISKGGCRLLSFFGAPKKLFWSVGLEPPRWSGPRLRLT